MNQLVFSIVGTSGGTSLEGGADGTQACDAADGCPEPSLGQSLGTTNTIFHLVDADGVLACGDTATQGGAGGTPTNSLERLNNASGSCVPIPYNLESSIDELHDSASTSACCCRRTCSGRTRSSSGP